MPLNEFKTQLLIAGNNIENNLYKTPFTIKYMNSEVKKYLLTLFNNKKLVKKIGRDFIINLWKKQGGRCAITFNIMTGIKNETIKKRCATNVSIDKIDPKLGYTKNNIQLTCLWANTGKLCMSTDEYRKLLLDAYNSMLTPPTFNE